LLSFSKSHDGRVIQKTRLPRTILDGQRDPDAVAEQSTMADVVGRTMSDTLTNHNELFIRSLMNVMKEICMVL
jgi:hypothetical protein